MPPSEDEAGPSKITSVYEASNAPADISTISHPSAISRVYILPDMSSLFSTF